MEIDQVLATPTNFTRGRNGRVDRIVIHVEEGTEAGTAATFSDPTRHASSHYGVGLDGRIYLFVGEADTAWHAGNSGVNGRSIGIELEGYVATLHVPDRQRDALVSLTAQLCARYAIPIDRDHIIGHCEVPDPNDPMQRGGAGHHTDPGPLFPWPDFIARLTTQPTEPLVAKEAT